MSKKEDKIIEIYKKKYDMNLGSFSMFLNQKIDASSFDIDCIQKKIKVLQIQFNFNEQSLKIMLRLIAAVQNKKNVENMNQQQIQKIQDQIQFKSSKNKNKKQKKTNNYQQKEQNSQIFSQSQSFNIDKYPSITYQIQQAEQKLKQYQKQSKQSDLKIKESLNKYQEIQIQVEQVQPTIQIKSKKQQPKKYSKQLNQEPRRKSHQKQKYLQQIIQKKRVQDIKQIRQGTKNVNQKNQQKKQQFKQKQPQTQNKQTVKQKQQIKSNNSKQLNMQQKRSSAKIQEKSSPKKMSESKLKTIYQENSVQINLPLPQQKQKQKGQPVFLEMNNNISNKKKVKITSYEKFSIDYVNSVIKFKVQYNGGSVQRRYSDFEKLMASLNRKYEGIILPQLPPKEGIKGGISYFWGIDENFLNQRQVKLQELLNRLLQSKFIGKDQLLERFLTEEIFEINSNQQGFGSYLKTVTDIVFNAKQLKDYGIAYFSYIKESGNVKLNNQISTMYESIQQIINTFVDLNSYRTIINTNFQKRRKIMFEQSIKCRSATNSQFDKLMDLAIQEIKNLHNQYNKYRGLKNQQSWISSLLKQKCDEVTTKAYVDLKKDQTQLKERLQKMQKNLMQSLQDFSQTKKSQLQKLGQKLIDWRKNVHP